MSPVCLLGSLLCPCKTDDCKELTARFRGDVEIWGEFGSFSARSGDYARAEQCYREALAQQQTHLPSLLAAAALAVVAERFQDVSGICVECLMVSVSDQF